MSESREDRLESWARKHAAEQLGVAGEELALVNVSGDASFRRYSRLSSDEGSLILVDAPPEHEDNHRFLRIARIMRGAGLAVPEVYAANLELGFMLLEDLGDELYYHRLLQCQQNVDWSQAEALYRDAIDALIQLQAGVPAAQLDHYGRSELHREMRLFDEWFCGQLLGLELTDSTRTLLAETYALLEDAALAQVQVAVHRDYHSRNLMLTVAQGQPTGPGILDFQDAVTGAYTYDLVSLLKDCYLRWPEDKVRQWSGYYLDQARSTGLVSDEQSKNFSRDFDLMGLQRHLKVLGIFSRLSIRDNKTGYLADIPLVIRYFSDAARRRPEMLTFLDWFDNDVRPRAASTLNLDLECEP